MFFPPFLFLHLLLPNFVQAGKNHNNWYQQKARAGATRQE